MSNDQEANRLSPSLPGRLCIKLKIPHNNNTNSVRQGGGGAEADQRPVDNSRSGYRICDICGKEFSSGKAWGGHKRHHLKTMRESSKKDQVSKLKDPARSMINNKVVGCKTIKAGDVKMKEGKPVCCLCGKGFPSMNGLFGHMKFHSGRDWKGTQPPLLSNNNTSSNLSNSICESEAESRPLTYVDLSSSLLSGWRKTDKRGKESRYDPDVYHAAMDLMKLSQDTRLLTQPLQLTKAPKLKITESDDNNKGFLRQELAKKMKKKAAQKKKYIAMLEDDNDDDELIRAGGFKCNACGSSFSTFRTLGRHRSSCRGKTPQESSQGSDENQLDVENQVIINPSGGVGNLFQCDICNKSFSTGQALGGHKRIHWKPIPVKAQFVPIKREYGYGDDDSDGYNRKLGFDLNEPYVLQDDE